MPDIPTRSRRVQRTATVGQAPLPLDIADTGAQAIGQGLAQLGAGVTNIGIATKQAEQRRQDMRDIIARHDSTSQMTASSNAIATRMTTEPDESRWGSFVDDERANLFDQLAGKTNISDGERGLAEARINAWYESKVSQIRLASSRQLVAEAQKTDLAALEMAYASGNAGDQAIAEDAHNLMKGNIYLNDKLAKQAHDSAVARGRKDFKASNISLWQNHASANPELTRNVLEDELADRKEGKTVEDAAGLGSLEVLSNSDITRLIRYADTAQKTLDSSVDQREKEIQEQTAIEMSGRVAEAKTYDERVSLIQSIRSAVQNETMDRKVGEGYIRELENGPDAPTDWPLVAELKLDIEAVRDRQRDFLEVYNKIQEQRGVRLGKSEADTLSGQVLGAKNIAENEAPAAQANTLRRYQNILKEYYNADFFGDTSDKKELPKASEKYAQIGEQLDRFIIDNPNASQKEIDNYFNSLTIVTKEAGIVSKVFKAIKRAFNWDGSEEPSIEELRNIINNDRLRVESRQVGQTEIVKGEKWILIKRGETPAEDTWQKQ